MTNQNPFADLIPKTTNMSDSAPSTGDLQSLKSNKQKEKMNKLMSTVVGFNTGVENLTHGIMQPVLENYLGENVKRGSQQFAKQRQENYQKAYKDNPAYATGGMLTGAVGVGAPLSRIPGVGKKALTNMLTSAAAQGGLYGASQYVNEDESRLLNAAIGGATAPLVGAGLRASGKLGAKGYNSIKSNYAKPAYRALSDTAKKWNVPLFVDDAADSTFLQGVGRTLEDVPILGTRAQKAGQMVAGKKAAEGISEGLKKTMDDIPFGGRTGMRRLQSVAESGGKQSKGAKNVLNQIDDAGDDWNKIMQTSGNVKLMRARIIAGDKYDKVSKVADKLGDVPTKNAVHAVNKAIKDVGDSVLPDKTLLNTLQTLKNNLSDKGYNYSKLRAARGDVGEIIDGFYKGNNAAVGGKGVGQLVSIKEAIGKDLDSFAQTHGGGLKTLWKNADQFYGGYVGPAKSRALAKALTSEKPDEIYSQFIKRGTREGGKGTGSAKIFYNALDNKGRAAVRYGMVSDGFEKAFKSDTGQFSPALFSGHLDRLAAAKGVFFKGAEKAEIDGFKNLMRAIQRSHLAVNKPETGVRNLPAIIAGMGVTGAAYIEPVTTTSVVGLTYAAKKLFTTEAGRRFLLSSSKLKPNSAAAQRAGTEFRKLIQQGVVAQEFNDPEQGAQEAANPFLDLVPAQAQ